MNGGDARGRVTARPRRWFYNRHWKFRPVSWVIYMLVDNVSKNGNLLLNVVQRPDGSIDPEVEKMLAQLADWNAVHGEAIFGSRPWLVYGESAVRVKGGSFNEDYRYSAHEIRFTTKGDVLYAISLGWPEDGQMVVHSLARPDGQDVNHITSVSLLGFDGKVEWKQTADGLIVTMPSQKVSEFTAGLKITGDHLTNVPFDLFPTLAPDASGKFTLAPKDADLQGAIQVEDTAGAQNLGRWDSGADSVSWKMKVASPGTFNVVTQTSSVEGADFVVEIGDQALSASAPKTGAWDRFESVSLGEVSIKQVGEVTVKVRAKDAAKWKPVNVRAIVLEPK